ncbi:MAG: NAD-binding protein [Sulfurimonas sp.]|uniref:NAD-binding protein n=1 Tax=Sulfurimonas sp. TaxID=2022749 RepID=UPI0026325075|nr:NAD-binding protein [Sulfurimonas sp.]MDD2653122.1 NAD-binding protein [Sulfurimonas sp.]MDD3451351.1 NAD-binding protein [Sulfurimonas sp.]
MKQKTALIFGYNDYALEIAKNLKNGYEKIIIYTLESDAKMIYENHEIEVRSFDLSDNWSNIDEYIDKESSIAFCVLEDSAENIFLTISLRSTFADLNIIALSNNKQTASKLQMAGANKVIPLVQTTAEMIDEMLQKPIVKEVFHTILFESGALKIAQVKINEHNAYIGKGIAEIDWSIKYGVVVLALVNKDMSSEFIYSHKIKHHIIDKDDLFIIVGYAKDIKEFENMTGSRCD